MPTAYLSDGKAFLRNGVPVLGDCCCASAKCVWAKCGVFYTFQSLGNSGTRLCTPSMENRFTRTSDGASVVESQKGHWSWLDGGSCNHSSSNIDKNVVGNGTPTGSGSSWEYELQNGRAVNHGTFRMTRMHLHTPDSDTGNDFRETFPVYLNVLSANTRILWRLFTGYATGSCTSATATMALFRSGTFDSVTHGAADGWAYQGNNYSYLGTTGGWYRKSFDMGISKQPVSTIFEFKVEVF